MKPLSRGTVLGFVAFVCLVAIWQTVHHLYGQTEGFRVWGVGLLIVALALSLKQSIPLHVGNREPTQLAGWHKMTVVLPTIVIGCAVSFYPHQVACSISLKNYVCS
jgi:hypothetical protein